MNQDILLRIQGLESKLIDQIDTVIVDIEHGFSEETEIDLRRVQKFLINILPIQRKYLSSEKQETAVHESRIINYEEKLQKILQRLKDGKSISRNQIDALVALRESISEEVLQEKQAA